jgi:ribosomal protein L37AE/L43A
MSKVFQIIGIESGNRGTPVYGCKKHLEWARRKFLIYELGNSSTECSWCSQEKKEANHEHVFVCQDCSKTREEVTDLESLGSADSTDVTNPQAMSGKEKVA